MKKILSAIVALFAAFSLSARAEMDDVSVSATLVTTNSQSWTYVLRGEIQGVYVDVAAGKTNAVLITSGEQTIFNANVASDSYFPLLAPAFSTTGVALTEIISGSTNAVLKPIAVAGPVTIRLAGAANTTGTNAVSAKIIIKK